METKEEKISRCMEVYGNMLFRLSFSYMKNKHDAEDVVQDVLIKFMDMDDFESKEYEKAWLLRVAINLCKNKLKMFWHKRVCSIDEIQEMTHYDDTDGNFVMEAVMNLPTKYRMVVYLYYYEGYKTPEIAQLTNQKEATVRSNLYRAREQLKIKLKEEYDFE